MLLRSGSALAVAHRKTDPVDGAKNFLLDRRLAAEQFSEHGGSALARIFLDKFFDEEKRLDTVVTPGLDPGVHRTR